MNTGIKTVGAYEAKTHLASLLNQVARGREVVITKRERPVARLVPINAPRVKREDVFRRIRAFHARHSLPEGETTKDLVNAGRRI
jgi:prevent-host-death family protein